MVPFVHVGITGEKRTSVTYELMQLCRLPRFSIEVSWICPLTLLFSSSGKNPPKLRLPSPPPTKAKFLLQCAEQVPHKIPLYGAVDALYMDNCDRVRILMRFVTVLMCSKVLQPGSVVVAFETLLSSAATTVDEEAGNPSWQARADFYITCILACLPWGGAELFEDFLEDLWDRIQVLSNNGWKVDSVLKPHLLFEAQLVDGKSHEFGPITCPEQPEPPSSLSGINIGKQKHDAELKYPRRLRRLNIFPASKAENMQPIDRFVVEEYLLDVLLYLNGWANFQFIWPWEEWAYVLELPKWAPQRVFVQEVLEREVRLSYWDKIKQILQNAVNKTYNRISDLRKEISSLEKNVVSAQNSFVQAKAELDAAESKLEIVDGEPVQTENPVRLKRLKAFADRAKEEEISIQESLEAKEALLGRAHNENEGPVWISVECSNGSHTLVQICVTAVLLLFAAMVAGIITEYSNPGLSEQGITEICGSKRGSDCKKTKSTPPLPDGFIGNAMITSSAAAKAVDLDEKPFPFCVDKVEAEGKVTNEQDIIHMVRVLVLKISGDEVFCDGHTR
ncbi:hypothetical protein MRB53_010694 [Persea americana]|uniref:Uncharacterized protein n=1 Tax=Persea americana TaxID=3435 RepID=A0ACC2LSP7_PERAE|nr:hypothetical protein MRB53_010694 [Persea americana]